MKNQIPEKILNLFPVILVFYEISNYLANDAYLPAMPALANELQTTHDKIQLTLTAFFLGNSTMQLILGPIADRYGRRRLLLGGGLLFIVTTLICALCNNVYALINDCLDNCRSFFSDEYLSLFSTYFWYSTGLGFWFHYPRKPLCSVYD